ncbi:protein FD-like [Lotus japonicus]|uniref:protein FD-like n=1 Tax=Lotus japonicus TaxID=34305 RepID=UPI002587E65D|nr:protein FD-like [Lotus japonicus]
MGHIHRSCFFVATIALGTSSCKSTSLYSPAPPLVTALSLNSRPDFAFDPLRPNNKSQLPQPLHHHHHPPSKPSSPCFPINPPPPFDNHLPFTSPLPCFGSNKRFAEPADYGLGDRRNKRMIKNRESAARSRARKQAYTNALKHKVDHLLEENARLKRQQQELWEAAAGQQKKKSNLYRSATAPF